MRIDKPTILAIANLTSNGFLRTTAGDGTLLVDLSPWDSLAPGIATLSAKTSPTGSDYFALMDSEDSNSAKKVSWATVSQLIPAREKLTAARIYYVRTDGNDSNDGLTNDSGGAFLTVQAACDAVANLTLNGYSVTVQIGDGTYTDGFIPQAPDGLSSDATFTIQGNSGDHNAVIISTTSESCIFNTATPTYIDIKNMKLQTTTSGNCVWLQAGGRLRLSGVNFGASAGRHIRCTQGSLCAIESDYTISGNASIHLGCETNSYIVHYGSYTVTLTGTPAFSTAFAHASNVCAIAVGGGVSYSGAATGVYYTVNLNATINTYGGGATFFPGDSSGASASGGQYA